MKYMYALLLGLIVTVLFALIVIPLLRKLKVRQSLNKYLKRSHNLKEGTPTMGGIIFIIPTVLITVVLILLNKMQLNYTILIVLFTLISYMIIGFIDDYLIVIRHNNNGLKKTTKLGMQLLVSIVFFYLFMKGNNEPLLWIHYINFKLDIGFLYGLFILFVLVASSNAVNLTDGLDGLATGLSIIAFTTFGIISYNTGWLEGYEDISLFAFILVGSLIGFLIFNKYPAKIFMGDTGSLALGATLGAYAIMTRHEVLLILIGFVFVLETVSVIIQVICFKLTKKRLFPMTPIHHTFEKLGFKEKTIVYLFWMVGLIFCFIALIYGVIL